MRQASFPRHRQCGRSMSGMTLIELMVAMVLGLIVMGAAFAVFMSNQRTFQANEGVNRIQENSRVAFELISRDIRAAAGSACSNASMIDSAGAFRDAPVVGNATELTVLSGDDMAYRVTASTADSVTLDGAQLAQASDVFSDGDVLLVCNARKTFVVTATGVAGLVVSHDPLPDGYDPSNDEFAPPASVVLARLRNVRWFVEDNGRGGSSLFVSRNGGAREEVAEGVENIAFSYLESGSVVYTDAPANWGNVIAVRTTMTFTGENVDDRALERTASNVVSMRSRTL